MVRARLLGCSRESPCVAAHRHDCQTHIPRTACRMPTENITPNMRLLCWRGRACAAHIRKCLHISGRPGARRTQITTLPLKTYFIYRIAPSRIMCGGRVAMAAAAVRSRSRVRCARFGSALFVINKIFLLHLRCIR